MVAQHELCSTRERSSNGAIVWLFTSHASRHDAAAYGEGEEGEEVAAAPCGTRQGILNTLRSAGGSTDLRNPVTFATTLARNAMAAHLSIM